MSDSQPPSPTIAAPDRDLRKPFSVLWLTLVSGLVLFVASSVRHLLFQSGAWDLGIFDQAVYLISRGQPPISSFLNFHILGDHAAVILYPIALLYRIYPSLYWLLAIQAIALAGGAFVVWQLALQAEVKRSLARALVGAYLLYPLIFNVNLFDFHPDVVAVPGLLGAVLAARSRKPGWFCLAIVGTLACKAVFALTVAALGVWLLLFEQRRLYGAIALAAGLTWFGIATQGIIPVLGGENAAIGRHLSRFSSLGSSFSEILANLLLKPHLLLGQLFTLPNLFYLLLLAAPLAWGFHPAHLAPLTAALPALLINLLSEEAAQKDLVFQYSLPILPFLLLAVLSALALGKTWLHSPRNILLWSLVGFVALAKFGYFGSRYLSTLDTWQATHGAIAQVSAAGSVLTTSNIAPHLTHRPVIDFAKAGRSLKPGEFDYVLLNLRHPGWQASQESAAELLKTLQQDGAYELRYQQDDVHLFVKKAL